MNKQLNEKINIIEQSIQDTKASLKSWANQISHYHKTFKALSKQLETIKKEITMKENNSQGGSN